MAISKLQMDHDKLLEDCAAILNVVVKDSERLRTKLGNVPWDIVNASGQGYLDKARTHLVQAEGALIEARKQIAHQRSRVNGD